MIKIENFYVEDLTFLIFCNRHSNKEVFSDSLALEDYQKREGKYVDIRLRKLKIFNKNYYSIDFNENFKHIENRFAICRGKTDISFKYKSHYFILNDSYFKRMKTSKVTEKFDYYYQKRSNKYFEKIDEDGMLLEWHYIDNISFWIEHDVISYSFRYTDDGFNKFIGYNYIDDILSFEYDKDVIENNFEKGNAVIKLIYRKINLNGEDFKSANSEGYEYFFYINDDIYAKFILLSPMNRATENGMIFEKKEENDEFLHNEIFPWMNNFKMISL
ncbi:hypothetical protein OKW22_001417 [Bacilli bacterium PM5-3]|nr:hypothetical protein [Bacilli bacterium PM5-3]